MGYIAIIALVIVGLVIFRYISKKMPEYDRKIQKPLGSLTIVGIVIVALLGVSFFIDSVTTMGSPSMHGFLRVYALFTQTNSVYSIDPLPENGTVLYMAISLLGAFLFSGLLISAFSNMFNQRIRNFRDGKIEYNFDDHVLIIGANSSVLSIINTVDIDSRPILRSGQTSVSECGKKIMIVTSRHPKKLQYIKDAVREEVWNRIYFINDNILDPLLDIRDEIKDDTTKSQIKLIKKKNERHYLHTCGAERCRKVYIIGDSEPGENDVANNQVLNYLVNYINNSCTVEKAATHIDCYVEYENLEIISSTIRSYESKKYKNILERLHVITFDYGMQMASKVWGASRNLKSNYPELKPGDDGICHIHIAGFNNAAAGMLKMAILQCHFGDGFSSEISVYHSPLERSCVELFKLNYALQSLTDIKVEFYEIQTIAEYADKFRNIARESSGRYHIVLSDRIIDVNIQLANAIGKNAVETNIYIYSEMPILGGITNDHKGEMRKNLHFFGNLNQALPIDSVVENHIFIYTIHNLITEYRKAGLPELNMLSMTPGEMMKKYEECSLRFFKFAVDPIRWRLLSCFESFCNIYNSDVKDVNRKNLLDQQISASILIGYSMLQPEDGSLPKDERFRLKKVTESDFDLERLLLLIDLYKEMKSRFWT